MLSKGFRRISCPTACAAPGDPAAVATALYVETYPLGMALTTAYTLVRKSARSVRRRMRGRPEGGPRPASTQHTITPSCDPSLMRRIAKF
jgi:hypothetical protein